MTNLVGGFGSAKEADEEVHTLLADAKASVEEKTGQSFEKFDAHSYKSQVVAGLNYAIKVLVGDEKYLHVTIHKPLPHKNEAPSVLKVEEGKTLADQL